MINAYEFPSSPSTRKRWWKWITLVAIVWWTVLEVGLGTLLPPYERIHSRQLDKTFFVFTIMPFHTDFSRKTSAVVSAPRRTAHPPCTVDRSLSMSRSFLFVIHIYPCTCGWQPSSKTAADGYLEMLRWESRILLELGSVLNFWVLVRTIADPPVLSSWVTCLVEDVLFQCSLIYLVNISAILNVFKYMFHQIRKRRKM